MATPFFLYFSHRKKQVIFLFGSFLVLVITVAACNSKPKSNKTEEPAKLEAEKGIHERDAHGEGEHEHQ